MLTSHVLCLIPIPCILLYDGCTRVILSFHTRILKQWLYIDTLDKSQTIALVINTDTIDLSF